MSAIAVDLPDNLKAFVEAEARAGGFDDPGAYMQELVRAVWRERAKDELERKLLESIDGPPAIELTPKVVEDLYARIHRRRQAKSA